MNRKSKRPFVRRLPAADWTVPPRLKGGGRRQGPHNALARHIAHLLPDLLVQGNINAARRALDELTRDLRTPRRVIALLVEEHGVKVLRLLVAHGKQASIWRWLEDLRLFDFQCKPAALDAPDLPRHVADLMRRLGAPRRVLARLIEKHGLLVFQRLLEYRDDPDVAALLELSPRRKRGRPQGSHARDPLAYAIATAVRDLRITPVKLLQALGRNPRSGSSDHSWLSMCRKRGDTLRAGATSPAPELPLLEFSRLYHDDDPPRLLEALIPYLVAGCISVSGPTQANLEQQREAQLRLALEPLLST